MTHPEGTGHGPVERRLDRLEATDAIRDEIEELRKGVWQMRAVAGLLCLVATVTILRLELEPGFAMVVTATVGMMALGSLLPWAVLEWRAPRRIRALEEELDALQSGPDELEEEAPDPEGTLSDSRPFYDDLGDWYDLIYEDWEGAMRRHAEVVLRCAESVLDRRDDRLRILDVSAGIGTQALPLARLGHEVTAFDLSPGAIERLEAEAEARGLSIETGVGDMREVEVDGPFDLVVSFDNSVPHLLNDEAILTAFREARRVLTADGQLLISVRDYAGIDRSPRSIHRYGERRREGRLFDLRQEWEWIDATHYRTTMIIDEIDGEGPTELLRTTSTYYAVELPRLLELMEMAGFSAEIVEDVDFYQPILRGRA